jgi:hypothetical protein
MFYLFKHASLGPLLETIAPLRHDATVRLEGADHLDMDLLRLSLLWCLRLCKCLLPIEGARG